MVHFIVLLQTSIPHKPYQSPGHTFTALIIPILGTEPLTIGEIQTDIDPIHLCYFYDTTGYITVYAPQAYP